MTSFASRLAIPPYSTTVAIYHAYGYDALMVMRRDLLLMRSLKKVRSGSGSDGSGNGSTTSGILIPTPSLLLPLPFSLLLLLSGVITLLSHQIRGLDYLYLTNITLLPLLESLGEQGGCSVKAININGMCATSTAHRR